MEEGGERFGAWEDRRRVPELLHAACLQAWALRLPPSCPRRWKEANGEGAAAGVLVLWEEGSGPGSHWHHICQAGAPGGVCGNGPQGAERRGRDVLLMLLSL